jgi:YggT family protein
VHAFRIIMQIITAGLTLYMLLIVIRILLSWFHGPELGKPVEILKSVTDPYLDWWRRFEFMRLGGLDFSPVVGIIALSVLASITGRLAGALVVTFGLILAIIIIRVGSAVGFFLGFFLLLIVLRLGAEVFNANTASRGWIMVDQIVQPPVHAVATRIIRNRPIAYRTALALFGALDLAVLILGGYVVDALALAASRLPF